MPESLQHLGRGCQVSPTHDVVFAHQPHLGLTGRHDNAEAVYLFVNMTQTETAKV